MLSDNPTSPRGGNVVDAGHKLQRDAVLPVIRVVARDATDEADMLPRNARSARLRFASPEVPEPLLLPADDGIGLDDDKHGPPVRPEP